MWGSISKRLGTSNKDLPTLKDLEEPAKFVQRALVVFMFWNYLIVAPAVSNHSCESSDWGFQWLGWLAIAFCLIAMSMENSPLVRAKIGFRDEWVSNVVILSSNCFVWEALGCAIKDNTAALLAARLLMTCAVALLCFVGLRWRKYTNTSLKANVYTTLARVLLMCVGITVLTILTVGPVFHLAAYLHDTFGCTSTAMQGAKLGLGRGPGAKWPYDRGTYRRLELGAVTGIMPVEEGWSANGSASTNSSNSSSSSSSSSSSRSNSSISSSNSSNTTADLRLNESILVGLHNSYHQSPMALSHVVQSWGYSHPSLYDQLQLGYRELEIDVHWKRHSVDWRVFHIVLLDQVTSCTCLSDCLAQVRYWMDQEENADHSPLFVHIEPRGYKYNDLFCERSDGEQRLKALQQEIFDLFADKIYFPDELTAGFPNIHDALRVRGWPKVADLRVKILFNLNLFSSNAACKPLYWGLEGANFAGRLAKSDTLAEDVGTESAPTSRSVVRYAESVARASSSASTNAAGEAGESAEAAAATAVAAVMNRKRKVFFNRGTFEEAMTSNTTCMMEVSTSQASAGLGIFSHGFITRFRIGKKPEPAQHIIDLHELIPATLISYDGVWPG